MAASAVGRFTPEQAAELERLVETAEAGKDDLEGRHRKRIDELSFHEIIADACPNPWLAFACKFMLKLLRDIVVIGRIYEIPLQEMSRANHCSHQELLSAFSAGDRDLARDIMHRHMLETAKHMGQVQGQAPQGRVNFASNNHLRCSAFWPGDAATDTVTSSRTTDKSTR